MAALLGTEEHGHWQIEPAGEYESSRRYLSSSSVLETTFRTATGTVTLTDLMPRGDGRADVVRRVRGVEGTVRLCLQWRVRMEYGQVVPWVRREEIGGEQVITAVAGPDLLVLRGPRLPDRSRPHAQRRVRRRGRRGADLLDGLDALAPPCRAPRRARRPHPPDHRPGRGLGPAVPHRPAAPRSRQALAADPAPDDPRGHRRDRRRPHDVAPRDVRRLAQLGLPLLLAPRRGAHPGLPARGRLLGRGDALARLAAARRRRRPRTTCR